MKIFFALVLFFSVTATHLYSQSISGKVIDGTYSEPLIGANVKIVDENFGAVTDLDGSFTIRGLKPGSYDLEFTYIGFQTLIVRSVRVNSGEVTRVDIVLKEEGIETEEITIEATFNLANENALLVEQKNASKIQDGISEQQIRRAPDAAASDVLKRVIGVNIVGDKFVYVRGTTDRYSLTTLNGLTIPSLEPDRKSFSFDLIPSNLLENIIIAKTFSADQPGNFSGGLVQVTTKDFPDQFSMGYSVSTGYNTLTTGNSFRSYDAGEKKFLFINLGLDDGTRRLPGVIPNERVLNTNFSNQQLKEFGRSFVNDWNQNISNAPLNGGFQLSLGNKFEFMDNPLGMFLAYSYKNGFDNEQIERTVFNSDFSILEELKGETSEYSVLQGGVLNLNYKLGNNHKIGSKNTFAISSEDETSFLAGLRKLVSEDSQDSKLFYTKFTERTLISTQLIGDHYLPNFNNLFVRWKGSYSESNRNEPDQKSLIYQRLEGSDDRFSARIGSVSSDEGGGRLFMDLFEINRNGGLDFNMPFIKLGNNSESKISFGLYANTSSRSFSARNFAPRIVGNFYLRFLGLDSIFLPENIDTNKFVYSELTRETDKYRASEQNYSGYLMFDFPYDKFRFLFGARYEYNRQNVSTFGRIGEPIIADLKNIDVLPSLNVTYALNENSNLRGSFSQTVSRPSIREIAPFGYIDFITGIGVVGNTELKRAVIQNFDLRYEIFPRAGEIVSLSLFYKQFTDPIEEVFAPGVNNPQKTFENISEANNYGIEIEVRKNLGFISTALDYFAINANLTLVNSKVDFTGSQTGATSSEDRRLQGQSPYTVNIGLFYDNYNLGTSVNFLYNKFGRRVTEVGRNGFEDIEEQGNDLIDFSASQKLFNNFELKFSAKDILGQDKNFYQVISDEEKLVRSYKKGSDYTFTVSYKF